MEIVCRGNSVEEAVQNGLKILGVSSGEAETEVISLGPPAVIRLRAERKTEEQIQAKDPAAKTGEKDVQEDEDGLIGIVDGRFVFSEPKGNGRYPSVIPGPGVRLLYNGKPVVGRTVVLDPELLLLEPAQEEQPETFEVSLSPDKMKAYLKYRPGYRKIQVAKNAPPSNLLIVECVWEKSAVALPSLDDMKKRLNQNSIYNGIDFEALKTAIQKAGEDPVLIAEGIPPLESEKDPFQLKIADNTEFVAPGAVLAEFDDAGLNRPGLTVTGDIVELPARKRRSLSAGNGVAIVGTQKKRWVATIGGRPVITPETIEILPLELIDGDLTESLIVDDLKEVVVKGSVLEGVMLRSLQNVHIYANVINATVATDGNLYIDGHITGSRLLATGGRVFYKKYISFFEEIYKKLSDLYQACRELKQHASFRTSDLVTKGEGRLIELLLAGKFKGLLDLMARVLSGNYSVNAGNAGLV